MLGIVRESVVREHLRERIERLPEQPGVYMMKDLAGKVIYVGKAVNLRARVRSYFTGGDEREFVSRLGETLGDIETVVVSNEKEALLLENELIRRYQPRFNIRPKRGKNFVYLRLDPGQTYPRLEVTRQVRADGARYFGPYPLARALRETLRVVNRYFKLRTCSDHDPAHHKRPCLMCQIADFPSPSVYDIPARAYRRHVADAVLFLEGRRGELMDDLRARMAAAAKQRRFEEAARLRDQLNAIERTLQPQEVVSERGENQDVFGYFRSKSHLSIYVMHVRRGRVLGGEPFCFTAPLLPAGEMLRSFVSQYYEQAQEPPEEVLLPEPIDDMDALSALIRERTGRPARWVVPQSHDERERVKMSIENAKRLLESGGGRPVPDVLVRLKGRLGLARIPHRMECFDVSHFQGGALVAAKVAMVDGKLDKDRYRRYKITSVQVGDDYAAMYEAVARRLRRGIEEGDLPELMVIDGGKGQLASARKAIRDTGAVAVEAIALAKADRSQGEEGAGVPERIYRPAQSKAVVLPQDAPELLLLAHLRDEAHRFAITYQRKLMRRQRLHSELDNIPGVGPKLQRALLGHFGSVDGVRNADVAALIQVEGVGEQTARRIHRHFHNQNEGTRESKK